MYRGWLALEASATRRALRAGLLRVAMHGRTCYLLRRALDAWHARAAARAAWRDEHSVACRALRRMFHRHLSRAWCSWSRSVEIARSMRRTLARLRHAGLARCLVTWASNAGTRLATLSALHAALSKLMNRELSKALCSWRDNAARRLAALVALRAAAASLASAGRRKAFNSWALNASTQLAAGSGVVELTICGMRHI